VVLKHQALKVMRPGCAVFFGLDVRSRLVSVAAASERKLVVDRDKCCERKRVTE
jgi:hypothetical protein